MSSSTPAEKPKQPKLDVEEYLTSALSATPPELHPFFESFRDLHSRKCARYNRELKWRSELITQIFTLPQAMASAHGQARPILRPPTLAALPSRCLRPLRQGFRVTVKRAPLCGDGGEGVKRY